MITLSLGISYAELRYDVPPNPITTDTHNQITPPEGTPLSSAPGNHGDVEYTNHSEETPGGESHGLLLKPHDYS